MPENAWYCALSCKASKTIPLYQPIYSSFSTADAFLAALPRSFFAGESFFGNWDARMWDARETASARRSARYPDLATWLAIPLYVFRVPLFPPKVVLTIEAAGVCGNLLFLVSRVTPPLSPAEITPTAYPFISIPLTSASPSLLSSPYLVVDETSVLSSS